MTNKQLLDQLNKTFKNQQKYLFDKHVPEFSISGKFLGDFFSQLAVEPRGEKPPIFYYTYSPFDVISGKAPHRAAVFEDGKLLLEIDFDEYVSMRTAAMSSVILQAINMDDLSDKKVLLFGSGNIAKQSLRFLKEVSTDLKQISCIGRSGDLSDIKKVGEKLGVEVLNTKLDQLSKFDVIICHTNTGVPILRAEHIQVVKKGAFIASFISSTEHGELADEFFNTNKANIICDWETTLNGAKEMSRAINAGTLSKKKIIHLTDLLNNSKKLDSGKDYTIYRSTGSPMQNLAVLQILLTKE